MCVKSISQQWYIWNSNWKHLHITQRKKKLQNLEALYIKINKINFEYSSLVLKCLWQFFFLPPVKFSKFPSHLFFLLSFHCSFPWNWLLLEPKVLGVGWKYGTFLYSFHPHVKWLVQRLECIYYKIGWKKVSVLLIQTYYIYYISLCYILNHIYIYIYILPHGGWALWRRNFWLPLA